MAQINDTQWDSILLHLQNQLSTQVENHGGVEIIRWADVVNTLGTCTLTEYQIQQGKVKAKKYNIKQFLTEDWKKFWNVWPSTKSVPGTIYKSGAKMKGMELKMHMKWCEAIEHEEITTEQMQYAAECYLQWGYVDSKRLKRNELLSRSGLEPWLNQSQYLIYKDIELPQEVMQEKKVYQNSTDM